MPDHEGACRLLLFGERQELRRKLTYGVAVERHEARGPEAVEDREQQQRVFREALRALQLVRSADVPAPQPPWFLAPHSL